jgi:DNA-binding Lrp family transcriptional regulator
MFPFPEFRLLNDFQRDFPLCEQPFAHLGTALGVSEQQVLEHLGALRHAGKISRVGAVFSPRCLGASTLAAMCVPAEKLAATAARVSRFPGVNHNYEREHRFNLWFVVTAANETALRAVLETIERDTACPLLSLPLQEAFHLDLGFPLDLPCTGDIRPLINNRPGWCEGGFENRPCGEVPEHRLLASLQEGLPLVSRPFAHIAAGVGMDEREVMANIRRWLAQGIISRFGVIVRHHELGYVANAMLVHDVPDAEVRRIGQSLAGESRVTLCYRRARALPEWSFNLFCMVHGRERAEVEGCIARLRERHGLSGMAHAILFSRTRFKQTGARYV